MFGTEHRALSETAQSCNCCKRTMQIAQINTQLSHFQIFLFLNNSERLQHLLSVCVYFKSIINLGTKSQFHEKFIFACFPLILPVSCNIPPSLNYISLGEKWIHPPLSPSLYVISARNHSILSEI